MRRFSRTLPLLIFTLLSCFTLSAQTDCDPEGDGNPDLPGHNGGQGQGAGGTNGNGDIAWELLRLPCDSPVPRLGGNYDPHGRCENSSALIPNLRNTDHLGSVKVAIIDSGVQPTKPGLFNNASLASFIVSSAGVVTSGLRHPHPHGTYSAGVISAMLALGGKQDIIHEFYSYQVLDGNLRTNLSMVVAAIDHAITQRVNVIALSIGFVPQECDNLNWEDPASPLYAVIERARQANVVVITSAGNDGNDLTVAPQYPAAYADLDNLVSVGALACEREDRAPFSNYGSEIVDVFTTGAFVRVYYNFCFYEIHGTSFATSIVAGKAALHFSEGNEAPAVLCLLRAQTRPFVDQAYSIYGIVDVNEGKASCGQRANAEVKGKALEEKPSLLAAISPNPFHDQLQITLAEQQETAAEIVILNGLGQRVFTRRTEQVKLTLDLSDLKAGVYWLTIQDGEKRYTRKIVKQ